MAVIVNREAMVVTREVVVVMAAKVAAAMVAAVSYPSRHSVDTSLVQSYADHQIKDIQVVVAATEVETSNRVVAAGSKC